MKSRSAGGRFSIAITFTCCVVIGIDQFLTSRQTRATEPTQTNLDEQYTKIIHPLVAKYCLDCHSTKAKKGHLDLERFKSASDVRRDLEPWPALIEQIEAGEMPPKEKPQPSTGEKTQLVAWARDLLAAEAKPVWAIRGPCRCGD